MILSGNKNLTSIKGRNSVTNLKLQKKMYKNSNLDLVNINTKYGQILWICSQDIEKKQNHDGRNDGNTEWRTDWRATQIQDSPTFLKRTIHT